MKKLLALMFCLAATAALAGSSTVNYTSSGTSPFRTTTDASTNNLSNFTVWDYSAGANGWSIDSSHGGLVAGEGTAGTPAGGVLTIQGTSSMTAIAASLASGAVASGAFASGALATGSGTDGWNVTEGTKADSAYTSGSGSIVSILKGIFTNTGAATPAGTNAIGTITGNVNVTPTDCSTTITTGGTAQNIISATSTLHGFTIANIDNTSGSGEPVWFSLTTTAAAATTQSYPLAAPTATTYANVASYTTPLGFGVNHAVSVIAATTGHKISCTYW